MKSKDIIYKLLEFEPTPCFQLFRQLLEALIGEARIRNDTAIKEDVLKNQGAIGEMKQLLKVLQATHRDKNVKDGAYGE